MARLVRLVRQPDGTLACGRALPGRGAWLCAGSRACIERAVAKGALERAFRAPVERPSADELEVLLADRPVGPEAPGKSGAVDVRG